MERIEKHLTVIEIVFCKHIEEVTLKFIPVHAIRLLLDAMKLAFRRLMNRLQRRFNFERLLGNEIGAVFDVLLADKGNKFKILLIGLDVHCEYLIFYQ